MSNHPYHILLGSASPRRRALLAGLDIPFTVVSIDADESYPADLQAGDIPYYISRAKARAYEHQLRPDQILITADTIVWLDGQMLGKPHTEAEAVEMLQRLRNKTHQVYTAVTIAQKISNLQCPISNIKSPITNNQTTVSYETIVDCTDVTFGDLTDEEIAYYVAKYRPLDKAGAYGIQEWIGYVACTAINGSYFNVMGFPVHRVYPLLQARLH